MTERTLVLIKSAIKVTRNFLDLILPVHWGTRKEYSFIAIIPRSTLTWVLVPLRVPSTDQTNLWKLFILDRNTWYICVCKKTLHKNVNINVRNSLTTKHRITLDRLTLFIVIIFTFFMQLFKFFFFFCTRSYRKQIIFKHI